MTTARTQQPGGPRYVVILLAIALISPIAQAGVLDQWQAWREAHFSAEQLADPNISGEAADPDNDDKLNIQEFAFGGDPWGSHMPSIPGEAVWTLVYDPDYLSRGSQWRYWQVTYKLHPQAAGLHVRAELNYDGAADASGTKREWTWGEAVFRRMPQPDGSVIERATRPLRTNKPLHGRLTAILPD